MAYYILVFKVLSRHVFFCIENILQCNRMDKWIRSDTLAKRLLNKKLSVSCHCYSFTTFATRMSRLPKSCSPTSVNLSLLESCTAMTFGTREPKEMRQ